MVGAVLGGFNHPGFLPPLLGKEGSCFKRKVRSKKSKVVDAADTAAGLADSSAAPSE